MPYCLALPVAIGYPDLEGTQDGCRNTEKQSESQGDDAGPVGIAG